MKEIVDSILSLSKGGFPIWLVVLLTLAFFISRIFQSYLTTYTNFVTPFELRRHNRLRQVTEWSAAESIAEVKDLLEEERHRLIFLDITGINASRKRRQELALLHRAVGGRYAWKDIRLAEPFLKQGTDGQIVRGVRRVFIGFMWVFFGLGLVTFGAGYYYAAPLLRLFSDASGTTAFAFLVVALVVFGILLIMAGGAFNQGLPVLRALQLQKWIPETHVMPIAGEVPSIRSSAPQIASEGPVPTQVTSDTR